MPKEEDERDERNESRRARGEGRGRDDEARRKREREREMYPRAEGGRKRRETGKQGTQREEERMVRCSRRAHIGSSPSPIGARGVGRV